MKKYRYYFLLFFMSSLSACHHQTKKEHSEKKAKSPDTVQKYYTNPILDIDFPDPTVIKAPDGYYYAYGTNTARAGKKIHIQIRKSKDLIHWKEVGDALPNKPSWANKDFWAPHVLYDKNKKTYYLYFSGESKADGIGKCLGVATSKSPTGPFKDKGTPLLCGDGFVNIDPMAYDDPETGKKLLFWGSGFRAIKVQELADDRMSFKKESNPKELIQTISSDDPSNYQNLVEGAWVSKHNDYYYIYFSGDNCCGKRAHYAVMVARSKHATGPYETYAKATNSKNSVILGKMGRWIAPGHNSVVTDKKGQDWMAYHAIDSLNRQKGRVMLLDKITYKNGWPVIHSGHPSSKKVLSPITQ